MPNLLLVFLGARHYHVPQPKLCLGEPSPGLICRLPGAGRYELLFDQLMICKPEHALMIYWTIKTHTVALPVTIRYDGLKHNTHMSTILRIMASRTDNYPVSRIEFAHHCPFCTAPDDLTVVGAELTKLLFLLPTILTIYFRLKRLICRRITISLTYSLIASMTEIHQARFVVLPAYDARS